MIFAIYFAVGNANTSRQETEIGENIKKQNLLGRKLALIVTAVIDAHSQFPNLYLFWENNISKKKE